MVAAVRDFASASGSANSTTVTPVTVPAAAQAGDYAHWFMTFSTASTITPPSGFTLIAGGQQVGNNNYLYWYEKTLVSGDLSASLTASSTVSGSSTVSVVVYSGSAGAVDAQAGPTLKTTGSTSGSAPAVTPVANDCLLLYVISSAASATTNTAMATTQPTGYTEIIDNSTTGPGGSFFRGHAVGWKALTGQAGVSQGAVAVTTGGGSILTREVSYSFTVAPSTFAAPANLTVTPVSASQMNLAWDAVGGASTYDVERDGTVVGSGVATNAYDDTVLTANTLYSYRVRASGGGSWCSAVTGTTDVKVTEAQNTFEGGADGTTITMENSGGASGDSFDWVAVPSGCTVSYSAAKPMRGALSGRIQQTTGGQCYLSYNETVGVLTANQLYGRAYFNLNAFPDGSNGCRHVAVSTSSLQFSAEWRINTSGQIEQRNGSGVLQQTSTSVISPGEWFRFEWAVLAISSTVGQLECQLFLTPDALAPDEVLTSAASLDTRVDLYSYWVGSASGAAWGAPTTMDMLIDDIAWSIYGYPGPSITPPPAYGQTVIVG